MSLIEDTYAAFMMDHAADKLSAPMALAADLHTLLSDSGAVAHDTWCLAADEFRRDDEFCKSVRRMEMACGVIASGYDHFRWRRGIFGAHYARSEITGGRYMRLLPGKSVPAHGHGKLEVTVVLEGNLSDGTGGLYAKGDIAFGIPGERHKPAAFGHAPCICFVAKA